MHITSDIRYIGVNDHQLDLFEGYYSVPDGMAYNSYAIVDEKIAIMDSVEKGFGEEWLSKMAAALEGRHPDYLVVQHMEPDHSSSIAMFMEAYPQAVIIASAKVFTMMQQFYGEDYAARRRIVREGDVLALGRHELVFFAAPMVHWPEVIMTYDRTDKVFFSADAFGKFGALDVQDEWACEARRYYFGIVGKYGAQVQALLKKVSALEIAHICPLHGPVLSENLPYYLNLYDIWSSYGVESEGVMIAYATIYGNTRKAAEYLAERLREKGCKKVVLNDLARCDMAEAVEDAFRYGKIVLAASSYNGDVFPFMRDFIHRLTERGYKNRTIGLMENGSWAPTAAKVMRELLAGGKDLTILEPTVKILSAMSPENREQIDALADELMKA